MPHFLKFRAVLSLAAVLTAYWAYTLFAVPFLEPQVVRQERSDHKQNILVQRESDDFSNFFPVGSWELDNPPKLKIDHGTLLFKNYKLLDDRYMKLESCTVLLYPDGSQTGDVTDKPPVILQSPAGATLEFDKIKRGRTGRLIGGRLPGQVLIFRPPSQPGARDDIQIKTRSVSISDQRLWTTEEVRFRYGDSYGSGRDLNVVMLSKDKPGQTFGNVAGLKSLELVHVQQFRLQFSESGRVPDGKRHKTDGTTDDSRVEVDITCRGPFRFDFERHTATFEDHVDVVNLHPNGTGDQLNCRQLEIHFAPSPKQQKTMNTKVVQEKSHSLFPMTRPESIVAFGHPVMACSPSSDFEARAQRLEYRLETGRVMLSGKEPVQLRHGNHKITTRTLEYELGRTGSMGRFWAGGPGSLKTLDRVNKSHAVTASWNTEVRLRPQNGQYVLSLIGQAKVDAATLGRISADELHCWLQESTVDQTENTMHHKLLGPNSETLVPSRLLAQNNVQIDSPQLFGQSQRLEVWMVRQNSDASMVRNPLTQTDLSHRQSTTSLNLVAGDHSNSRPQRLNVRGQVIQVEMQPSTATPVVANITVNGNVSVTQTLPHGVGRENMSIVGDILRVRNTHSDGSELFVKGSPAKIHSGKLSLSGNLIQLDQTTHQTSINGPGTIVTMVDRDLQGKQLSTPQRLGVTWQEKMEFDGIQIHVEKDVGVNTQNGRIAADRLDIRLNRRINFFERGSSDDVEPQRVDFTGNVRAEHRTVAHDHLQSIDRMLVPALSINLGTGKLHADGPGRLTTVRYVPKTFFPNASNLSGTNDIQSDNLSLFFLGVEFQKSLNGKLLRPREFHFEHHIRTVYGPVSDWTKSLDMDIPEGLGPQDFLMTCRYLSLYDLGQSGQDSPAFELTASGNTLVEGKSFTARAQRITYAKTKDVLIIEGGTRSDAELWYEDETKGSATYLPARKIFYWPNTQRIKVEEIGTPTVSGF